MKNLSRALRNAFKEIKNDPSRMKSIPLTALRSFREGGVQAVREKMREKSLNKYQVWYSEWAELSEKDRRLIGARIERMKSPPLISLILPVTDASASHLADSLQAASRQLYTRFELTLAVAASDSPQARDAITQHAAADSRIKLFEGDTCLDATQSALLLAQGDWVAFVGQGDVLSDHALYLVAEELAAHPDADLVYSDEDKLNRDGKFCEPFFKPDWNPDLFYSQNYIQHFTAYRTAIVKKLGGLRAGFEGSEDYDLTLRLIETAQPSRIRHIPHVLYHRCATPGAAAASAGLAKGARKALQEHFERQGRRVKIQAGHRDYHRVVYDLPEPAPRVSAVICTRDRHELLQVIVDGLLEETDYPNLEILIVDNQSTDPDTLSYFQRLSEEPRIRIIPYDHPFNYAAMNNFAVKQATGQVVVLLNNDLKVIHREWLQEMVTQALRPEIGAVGAKLYYEDGTIQHAGVTLGINGVAGHAYRLLKPGKFPGMGDRTHVSCCYSAVTGACMAIRKETFDKVGGFNEKDLAISFNDVDLCIRVGKLGLRNLFTPYAELYHFESVSRGPDNTDRTLFRFTSEYTYMWSTWNSLLRGDPYYSPNLTVMIDDFRYSTFPRVVKPWVQE